MTSASAQLADFAVGLASDAIPFDVIEATKLRILDVIGLSLAGHGTEFGQSVIAATAQLHPSGPARVLSTGQRSSVAGAALANGALSQAFEFDDTHNRSIVHMSSPSVSAALALAEETPTHGSDLIAAIAIGSEISCRVGSVAPQQLHRLGFHPTGIFTTIGTSFLAARLMRLEREQTRNAAGIAGSFASGLLQCWVDGTQSKFLHPGWSAQSGISAAVLALHGATGPEDVIEGRFGLIESHLQDASIPRNYEQVVSSLGEHWESRNASFKPYPVAHVIHPYIDAILRLRAEHGFTADDIESVECPIAPYQVGIVCEPLDEKLRPQSDSHGRVSLQFTLAEAVVSGRIDLSSYGEQALSDPHILELAQRIIHKPDTSFPGPERFAAEVTVRLRDGRTVHTAEPHNRGSAENPMSRDDVIDKFHSTAARRLSQASRAAVVDQVDNLSDLPDASTLVTTVVNALMR